jgi:hypothetical protein
MAVRRSPTCSGACRARGQSANDVLYGLGVRSHTYRIHDVTGFIIFVRCVLRAVVCQSRHQDDTGSAMSQPYANS